MTLVPPHSDTGAVSSGSSNADRGNPRSARIAVVLTLIGLANNAWSLRWGFQYDDYLHQFALRGLPTDSHVRPWNLYDFGPRPGSVRPHAEWRFHAWWADPDFKVRFFRPVTSVSIGLDYRLYRDWAPGYHLTSLALFAVLLRLSFRLYRELGAPPSAALWALAVLSLSPVHIVPVGWIANRNTLLAALFVVATIRMVHRHRQSGRRCHLAGGLICFLLACGSKESGLVGLPLMAMYLSLYDPVNAAGPFRRVLSNVLRSRMLWAFTLTAVAYLTVYLAAGYGARSVVYPTPWDDPIQCLRRLAVLVPVGLLSLFFGFPADLMPVHPWLTWVVVFAGVPFLTGVGWVVFRIVRPGPSTLLACGWVVCSLLVEIGADLSDRLFVNAAVGSSLLVGLFLHCLRPVSARIAAREHVPLIVGGMLVLSGVVTPVISTAIRAKFFSRMAAVDRDTIVNADVDRSAPTPRSVFLLNAPSSLVALSMSGTWGVAHHDGQTYVYPLQMGRRPLTWRRDDERTMTLTSRSCPFMDHRFERLFRTARTGLHPGATFEAPEFTAVALAVEPTGIRSVRFVFRRSLNDASYFFLAWRDGRLVQMTPPPPGQTVELSEVPSPTAFAP